MERAAVEKNKCFVSTVVYVCNRSLAELEVFCDKILRKLTKHFENNEVIFVMDGHQVIDSGKIGVLLKKLRLNIMAETVQMAYYQGIEAAMCAGDDLAIGDFIFEFDTIDVDYDEELVLTVFNRAREGYDIVSAGDDTMSVTSRMFYRLINHKSNYELRHESFRIVSRRAINRIKILNNTVPYRKALYAASGLPTDYIKYTPVDKGKRVSRNHKESSYRLNSGINYTKADIGFELRFSSGQYRNRSMGDLLLSCRGESCGRLGFTDGSDFVWIFRNIPADYRNH